MDALELAGPTPAGATTDDGFASALAEARRVRELLRAGAATDPDCLTASIDRLEQALAAHLTEAGPAGAARLIALLDEIGGLAREIETARAAVGARLAGDRRRRQAGSAYRRLGAT